MDGKRALSRSNRLHGHFHSIESGRFSVPIAGERKGFLVRAGHGNGHMFGAGGFVVRGIKAESALAGGVDFRPGIGGTVLTSFGCSR